MTPGTSTDARGGTGTDHPISAGPTPPDPVTLAVITAAVQLSWPRPGPADEHDPVHLAWRFSGRWWHKPVPLRRDRPWTRH